MIDNGHAAYNARVEKSKGDFLGYLRGMQEKHPDRVEDKDILANLAANL